MSHHSAIVHKILSPGEVEIAHQAFNGNAISTYEIESRDLQAGRILAFRPSTGDDTIPEPVPRRITPPKPVELADGSIDLLKTLDPDLDFVHGYWHRFDGPLTNVRENFSKLQIPVDLPEKYTWAMRVRRVSNDDAFAMGVVVGDTQTLLVVDAYGGATSGIHRLDGKKANANATTKKQKVFEGDAWVNLECQVTPRTIKLTADGKSLIDWTGNPSQLSVDEKWIVPNTNWLFIACNDNAYEIQRMILTKN